MVSFCLLVCLFTFIVIIAVIFVIFWQHQCCLAVCCTLWKTSLKLLCLMSGLATYRCSLYSRADYSNSNSTTLSKIMGVAYMWGATCNPKTWLPTALAWEVMQPPPSICPPVYASVRSSICFHSVWIQLTVDLELLLACSSWP